jgi:transcriptional regulator with XRE-family HTH domain
VTDNELGAFLRSYREAITPADVGLPNGTRRRTQGLRRAELAALAGISVEYLTRLEQGRDRHPSAQVLGALADALRLSAEGRYVLRRAAMASEDAPCDKAPPPSRAVRATVQALLERLEPAPAAVVNRLSDVLASTSGYERLAGPTGMLDAHSPNLLRFVFTDMRARSVYPEWDRIADEWVARLKAGSCRSDPYGAALADEMATVAGAPFVDRFHGPPSIPDCTGVERIVHPALGELLLTYETLDVPFSEGQCVVVYLPADEATAAALDRATAVAGTLLQHAPPRARPSEPRLRRALRAESGRR